MRIKRQTSARETTGDHDTPPKTAIEWQVVFGHDSTVYVFHTVGSVSGFLESMAEAFAMAWDPTKSCRFGVEVRRVVREVRR